MRNWGCQILKRLKNLKDSAGNYMRQGLRSAGEERPHLRNWRRFLCFVVAGEGNPVLYLWVVLGCIVLLAFGLGCVFGHPGGIGKWIFTSLFDINTVIASSKLSACASALLFAFTWFLGSGALFSALVTRCLDYRNRRRNGLIHHDFSNERGHVIILGWDDNVPTLIREISEYDKFMGRANEVRRVAVVTIQDAPSTRKFVRTCGKDENLYVSVCRGYYDDAEDIVGNFSLGAAREIFIIGEPGELGHDAKMLNLVARLNKRLGGQWQKKDSQIVAHVKIASFLLFSRLKRSRKPGNRYPLLLDYFNFYDNWSKRLWAMLPTKEYAAYPALRFMHHDCKKKVRVVIIGFSQMGQALAVEAARVAHYGDDVETEIVVIGENTAATSLAFLREYPGIKAPTAHLALSRP